MKKKTINELYAQLVSAHKQYGGIRLILAHKRAFKQHFGVTPHSKECQAFIEKYGCNYPM